MCADEDAVKYAIYTYGPVLAGVDFPTECRCAFDAYRFVKP